MRHLAFIRAVMVGREGLHRGVILEIFEQAGAADAVSHLATGNVSFDVEPSRLDALQGVVEEGLSDVVGRRVDVFMRTLAHLRRIDADSVFGLSPFPTVRDRLVTFFHDPPDFATFSAPALIQKERTAVLMVDGCDVFSVTRTVDGQTGSPGGVFERESSQRATTRGWGTVEKILTKHASAEQ